MRTAALGVLALGALALACTTSPKGSAGGGVDVVVTGDGGAQLWRGPATFTVRSAREGKAERVVSLPGLGEIQVALDDDDNCRLVWSKHGLDALALYEPAVAARGCGERTDGRLCFASTKFARPSTPAGAGGGGGDERLPSALVVDGCADENDLLWGKLDGRSAPATVGPRSFRQRCRPIATKQGCELVYARKLAVEVAGNDAASADDGFALVYAVGSVDGWRACFLERETGAYRIRLFVEDSCGNSGTTTLSGDSADLED